MINRRDFLRFGLAVAASSVLPFDSLAEAKTLLTPERSLKFYNTHTSERLSTVYWSEGQYLAGALKEIDHILRDHRTGDVVRMDERLLDLLFALQSRLETSRPFHIISGYRSPKTNQMLNKHSSGVAKSSLHMKGKAIDIRLPGTDLRSLRKEAVSLRRGGVGFYPDSEFIHIDTGRVRYW